MDLMLFIDIVSVPILIAYLIYIKRNKPIGEVLFESRKLPYTSVVLDLIAITIFGTTQLFHHYDKYFFILIILALLILLIRCKKKFYIYTNDFYYYTIFGMIIHMGNFSKMIKYSITEKGHLYLRFGEPNGDIRHISIPGKFNKYEVEIINRIFKEKGF